MLNTTPLSVSHRHLSEVNLLLLAAQHRNAAKSSTAAQSKSSRSQERFPKHDPTNLSTCSGCGPKVSAQVGAGTAQV